MRRLSLSSHIASVLSTLLITFITNSLSAGFFSCPNRPYSSAISISYCEHKMAEQKPEAMETSDASDNEKLTESSEVLKPDDVQVEEENLKISDSLPENEGASLSGNNEDKDINKEKDADTDGVSTGNGEHSEAAFSKDAPDVGAGPSSSKKRTDTNQVKPKQGKIGGSSPKKSKENVKVVSPLKKTDSDAMRILDKGDKTKRQKKNSGRMEEEEEEGVYSFPDTLDGFGYHFNENGELRSLNTNERYEFRVREDDHSFNQKRYEALGEIITEHVYQLLIEVGLEKVTIPINAREREPKGFFFMSPGALEKDDLLLVIHGSGVVRAGQWTRKLLINNDLDKGSQLPYIRFGLENGFGVVVLNTNMNRAPVRKDDKVVMEIIECSRFPEPHGSYVWDNFITESAAKNIAVVAHSYGGIVTSYLADERKDFQRKVFAVAFTDSVHSLDMIDASKRTRMFFAEHAVNWVSSDEPLDTELNTFSRKPDAMRVSAGHEKHEWTSYAAMESVFAYIKRKHVERLQTIGPNSFCTNL